MIKRNLLGLTIYDTNMNELVEYLNNSIKENVKKTVFGISAGAYPRLKFRRDLGILYPKFDIMIAEGAGIHLLGKLFGVKVREKIGLTMLTKRMLKEANKNNYSILLFGSTDNTLKKVEKNIKKDFKNVNILPSINGYFSEQEIPVIIEKINQYNPDILLVGISYPIKERFVIKYKKLLNAKLIIPCGGAFEVLAGNVKKPSFEIKYLPTAWLYRFIQEPIRLFKPIMITMLYGLFYMYPYLYLKHILHIEKNPSVLKFFSIKENEWDIINGKIKSK